MTTGSGARWEHRQPATGGRWESAASGAAWALTELDPLGADVGTESPYGPGVTPAEPIIFDSGSHWATRAGAAGDPQSGCNATGLALPCELVARMLRNNAVTPDDTNRDPLLPPGFGGILEETPGQRWRHNEGSYRTREPVLSFQSIISPNSSFFLSPQRSFQLGRFGFSPEEIKELEKAYGKITSAECERFFNETLAALRNARQIPADPNHLKGNLRGLLQITTLNKYRSGLTAREVGVSERKWAAISKRFDEGEIVARTMPDGRIFLGDRTFQRYGSIAGLFFSDYDTSAIIVHELFHRAGLDETQINPKLHAGIQQNCGDPNKHLPTR